MMNMNTTIEMTRTEILAEIKRLAALAIQADEQKDPEETLAEISREMEDLKKPYFDSIYYVNQVVHRESEATQSKKNVVLSMLETMGFKPTGNGIYSLKIGECEGQGDFAMKLQLTVCGEPTARIYDDGAYQTFRCKTVEDAVRLYKLNKKAIALTREIRYGNAIDTKLQECIDRINGTVE